MLDILKLKYLKEHIDSKLKEGVIVPSKLSLDSLVILVPKSSGKLVVCVDYRRLNNITETDIYPLPLLDNIISSISGSKVYSKINLKDAFHQVPVMDSCCPYTAFKCKFGVFEYTTMPFGLKNAPAVFQRMTKTLGPLLGSCCVAYMDDILVFSPLEEQHKLDLEKVLSALSSQSLVLKRSKCEFYKKKVTFLGSIIF